MFYINVPLGEDLALTLNGKKNIINRKNFLTAFSALKLNTRQQENIFIKMEKAKGKWLEFIEISFLSHAFKLAYSNIIQERFLRIKEWRIKPNF